MGFSCATTGGDEGGDAVCEGGALGNHPEDPPPPQATSAAQPAAAASILAMDFVGLHHSALWLCAISTICICHVSIPGYSEFLHRRSAPILAAAVRRPGKILDSLAVFTAIASEPIQ